MKISLVLALMGTTGGAAWAQPQIVKDAPVEAPLEQVAPKTYSIRIRNVKPSLMAYWLDPTNHEWPVELGIAPAKTTRSVPQNKGLELPTGVDRIVAVDPQEVLLVFGTPEGADRLRATITFLDKPLRQVEVEAQFVQINTSDLHLFGLGAKAESNAAQPEQALVAVRGNFSASIAKLEKTGTARTLSMPRVTAFNNLTASLSQSLSTPVEIGVRDAAGLLRPLEGANVLEAAPLSVRSELKLEVTPTINNDDTTTLLVDTGATRQLVANRSTTAEANPAANGSLALNQNPSLKTILRARDGETIALFNPNWPKQPMSGALSTQTTIVTLVTARIVRRAGE